MLDFVDVVAGVGDGDDNGPNAFAFVAGCGFLSAERVWRFGRISTS